MTPKNNNMLVSCPPNEVWDTNRLALLAISPASIPALPMGFFRAFCKLFNWLPAF